MSKGNMLLGHARGKVGDLVFSRVNGQQVTRSRAAVVKNPQTTAQMIQRILLNTVIQAYSRMSEICDHSFEGVQTGQKSMSAFMRKNLSYLRTYLASQLADGEEYSTIYAFAPVGTNVFTMNPYIVSTGSLPQIDIASISALNGATVAITAAAAVPTYQEIIDSLGVQRGDQLTFIGQLAYSDSRAAFKYARVILDPRDSAGNEMPLSVPFLDANNAINYPSPRNEGEEITFSSSATTLTFTLASNSMFGAAVIVSRQREDGSWLRSNAQIVLDASTQAVVGSYSMQDALDMLANGGLDLQSSRYLNNARRLTAADTASVSGLTVGNVTLVGLRDVTLGDKNFVVGVDADGNLYYIQNDSSYSAAYGSVLMGRTGYLVNAAWNASTSHNWGSETTENPLPTGATTLAVNLEQGSTAGDEAINWLIANGVSWTVFVASA